MGGKDIAFLEPMANIDFVTSDGNVWELDDIEYVGQTINNLPTKLTWTTKDGVTTITLEGKSDVIPMDDMKAEGDDYDHEHEGDKVVEAEDEPTDLADAASSVSVFFP